jgi:hypothetical protein
VSKEMKKPENLGEIFKQDMSFLKDLSKKSNVLTENYFYLFWLSHELQVGIEPLLSCKRTEMDKVGLLALIAFAGIDFDEEELFKSEIIENTFEDETFSLKNVQKRMSSKVQAKCVLHCYVYSLDAT